MAYSRLWRIVAKWSCSKNDIIMEPISLISGIVAGLAIGFIAAKFIFGKINQSKIDEINAKSDLLLKEAKLTAKRIIDDAETQKEKIIAKAEAHHEKIKQKKIEEARAKYAKLKLQYQEYKAQQKIELKEKEMELKNFEKELEERQASIQEELDELEDERAEIQQREKEIATLKASLEKQQRILAEKREKLEKANEERIRKLETISGLSQEEAKQQILEAVKAKADTEAMAIVKEAIEAAKATANKEAKKIVVQTIQRMASEYTIENTVSVFKLDSDDVKGQIIGREGRNIRALESATGVEIIVDDTPEAIVISSYDPIRREIARLSLQRLVADGRMHPARIEEVVAKVRKELSQQIVEIGERTVIDLDIHGLHPYLIKMVGRMRFRSSYGQNLLKHSIEVANLSAMMAAELGLSPKAVKQAKRAGLLHDIGKVAEEESELSHALYGFELCKKYKEHPAVCNAVGAHHDEIEMTGILSPIVQACDAISGARPGARREILENYMKRIKDLEELALSHEGVQTAYAMQAGRELRVIVSADKTSDQRADDLAFIISQQIQEEMQYPGQIRVTVIREKRAVSFAR